MERYDSPLGWMENCAEGEYILYSDHVAALDAAQAKSEALKVALDQAIDDVDAAQAKVADVVKAYGEVAKALDQERTRREAVEQERDELVENLSLCKGNELAAENEQLKEALRLVRAELTQRDERMEVILRHKERLERELRGYPPLDKDGVPKATLDAAPGEGKA